MSTKSGVLVSFLICVACGAQSATDAASENSIDENPPAGDPKPQDPETPDPDQPDPVFYGAEFTVARVVRGDRPDLPANTSIQGVFFDAGRARDFSWFLGAMDDCYLVGSGTSGYGPRTQRDAGPELTLGDGVTTITLPREVYGANVLYRHSGEGDIDGGKAYAFAWAGTSAVKAGSPIPVAMVSNLEIQNPSGPEPLAIPGAGSLQLAWVPDPDSTYLLSVFAAGMQFMFCRMEDDGYFEVSELYAQAIPGTGPGTLTFARIRVEDETLPSGLLAQVMTQQNWSIPFTRDN